MPNLKQKKKMQEEQEKQKKRKSVVVKTHPSYPTPAEYWQTVQVRCDPSLRENALPGMLSGISAVPESISKWMDKNCRFALGEAAPAVPGAPAAGATQAAPAQGETAEKTSADKVAEEATELVHKWAQQLGDISVKYAAIVHDFNSGAYNRASDKIMDIIQTLKSGMMNTAGLMIKNTVLKAHKDGDIKDERPAEDQIGRELTGMDAIQMALYNVANMFGGKGPLGIMMDLESLISSKSTPPVLNSDVNPNVIRALEKANYFPYESQFLGQLKVLQSLKNMPFENTLSQAAATATTMAGIINSLASSSINRRTR